MLVRQELAPAKIACPARTGESNPAARLGGHAIAVARPVAQLDIAVNEQKWPSDRQDDGAGRPCLGLAGPIYLRPSFAQRQRGGAPTRIVDARAADQTDSCRHRPFANNEGPDRRPQAVAALVIDRAVGIDANRDLHALA